MNDEHRSAEFESSDPRLEAAVQAVLAQPLPEDAVDRVKARARDLTGTDDLSCRIVDSRTRGWRIPRSIAASLAVAASLLVVVTAVALLLDRSGSRAFAQMVENVKAAATVRFTTTERIGVQPQIVGRMYIEGNRLRRERMNGVLVEVADFDRNEALGLDTHGKRVQRIEIDANVAQMFVNPIDQLRRVTSDDAEQIGEEILRGRLTQVYRLRDVDLLGIKGHAEMMVWIDAESKLPAKIVIRDASPKSASLELRFDEFDWNEPLDPGLFSLDVPEGYEPGTIFLEPKEPKAVAPGAAPRFVDGILRDRVPAHILWSRDGATITAVMRDPESTPLMEQQSNELRQWDVATGKLRWSEDIGGAAGVAATADGKFLATVVNYEVQVREATTGQIARSWATDELLGVLAFSSDGKTLAAGISHWAHSGNGEQYGGIQFWDVERGTLVRTISDHDWPTTFIEYSVDGKYLASYSRSLKLWDVATGELARIFPGRTWADFSPDGTMIACPSAAPSADKTVGKVDLYDLHDGSLVRSFASEAGPSKSRLLRVAFSPDGRLLAATDWNGTVTVWNAASGQRVLTITDHEAGVVSVAFAPDGATLATGSEDNTLRLWKLPAELNRPAPED